jgi:hypothetical protein
MARRRTRSFRSSATPKRRGIVLLFALGIVLPSALLGYLAFRGVQNDRALLEKERLDESRRIANRVVTEIDEHVAALERAFGDAAAEADRLRPAAQETATDALERFKAEHPLVEQVFLLQESGSIDLPLRGVLYLPDSGSQDEDLANAVSPRMPAIRNAER